MSQSNVGSSGLYEGNEQKAGAQGADRFHEGKSNSHNQNDPKDERSIANKLDKESRRLQEGEAPNSFENEMSKKDATKPAQMHGNAPSKGAKLDQEIQEEEAEMMKKKGEFGHKSGKK